MTPKQHKLVIQIQQATTKKNYEKKDQTSATICNTNTIPSIHQLNINQNCNKNHKTSSIIFHTYSLSPADINKTKKNINKMTKYQQ